MLEDLKDCLAAYEAVRDTGTSIDRLHSLVSFHCSVELIINAAMEQACSELRDAEDLT